MVIHSDQPHLVGIDPDILSTGLVFFYLKSDCTTVGSHSADPPADIVVPGVDIADQHCQLAVQRGRVLLHPLDGDCYINRCRVTSPGRLRQGLLSAANDPPLTPSPTPKQVTYCSWVGLPSSGSITLKRQRDCGRDTVRGCRTAGGWPSVTRGPPAVSPPPSNGPLLLEGV
jgi:hypothetical protein